jgi:hypothetical protein
MSFNLFGPARKEDIRVGYISTERGFISDVTLCEANDYAKLNPGTRFIFRTRDDIKFLNINEVNNLTPDDLASSEGECKGIQLATECGPAQAYFYGGGGVGVKGNPVIGQDGSVLAVDLVSGGFGYQYPPIVEVKDNCGIGAGVVTRAVLGEIVETVEYYDQAEDFENYEICEPTDVGYGLRYGPNGESIGSWDPSLYANLSEDPIRREIEQYQDFLQKLSKPWWSTRKKAPLRLTSANKTTRTKFDVNDSTHLEVRKKNGEKDPIAWNEFMNSYAISPVPPSNVRGSDFAGIPFTFEWEEDFPYDGEYIFRGLCDNKAEFYLDNVKIADLKSFTDSPEVIKKTITAGVHRIRLDLLNGSIKEKTLVSSNSQTRIFNTIDYINKADRTLWRTNPSVGRDGDFLHQYGITPFDSTTKEANTNSFAGTHTINWRNVNFPFDGNYSIELMVDDNVTLTFTGPQGEIIITKRGFSGPAKSTGKTIETKFFKSGNYSIKADLEQIPGKPLAQGNPMSLAINITSVSVEKEVVSAKSWNENPMGVALTIEAPNPPIPQEPVILQEGRCPKNPIWTTRYPNANERWYPVRFDNRWSKFMNRYAISPVPPLSEKGSDSGGVVYRNSWNIDIPYDGFYALRGTVDNFGKILIDRKEVSKLNSFKTQNPDSTKIFLTKGLHEIQIEVENQKTDTFVQIDKKIFSTSDWVNSSENLLKNGVSYSGPTLSSYRTGSLGPFLTPTFTSDQDYRANNMGRSWISRWSNVDFPEDGRYELKAEADDEVIVRVDGTEVGRAKVFEGVRNFTFNATKGKRTIEMEFRNIPGNSSSNFETNPVVFNVLITKKVNVSSGISKPWTENPIGISAILIPPPCPKRIRGKGVVTDVEVDDPGNGYPIPQGDGYPVSLRLKNVVVENPGINYNCGVDQIQITPSNGAILDYRCDSFGRIREIIVANPGLGFTSYPEIKIPSDTGVNARFRPQFEVVRDPIVIDPQKLIQVTDLVGLKQTGYVDGRPYYGAVFYKDGIRYAGFYETPGDLVQVYTTLQESIETQVTTPPSAILRQGTDVTSNDPRLNIPRTPENLI